MSLTFRFFEKVLLHVFRLIFGLWYYEDTGSHAVARRQCESKTLESKFSIPSALCAELLLLAATVLQFLSNPSVNVFKIGYRQDWI